ncbi:hypothetical protein [Amycolatopsis pithecellobii]|uniref:CdiI immunity protein domain-containing protein n=1 Tax=Amycolatopsis pithecellobii TaxID=664692 RepID=A0A6N7YP62_9PSEU|nr:hypothetical protein [Amycolatopsis pithecellobii]MTD54787.1 hypothetical protein [Amycolatopsis pithecellobii]
MRISQRLQDFLTGFCGADEDLGETARVLRSSPDSELARWLRPELDAAIRGHLLPPDDFEYLTSRRFSSATDVANWLNSLHQEWFG